ncbi:hypothetical protein ScPMuIL_005233, partial [Solemya velum]
VTGTQFTHAVLQTKHCSKSKRKFWDSSKNVSTMQSSWVDWRATGVTRTQFTHAVLQTKHCSIEEKILLDSSKNVSTMQSSGVDWRNRKPLYTEITNQGFYELRVNFSNFQGNSHYAHYNDFSVGDASSKYLLTVFGYNETQGTVLTYNN